MSLNKKCFFKLTKFYGIILTSFSLGMLLVLFIPFRWFLYILAFFIFILGLLLLLKK